MDLSGSQCENTCLHKAKEMWLHVPPLFQSQCFTHSHNAKTSGWVEANSAGPGCLRQCVLCRCSLVSPSAWWAPCCWHQQHLTQTQPLWQAALLTDILTQELPWQDMPLEQLLQQDSHSQKDNGSSMKTSGSKCRNSSSNTKKSL